MQLDPPNELKFFSSEHLTQMLLVKNAFQAFPVALGRYGNRALKLCLPDRPGSIVCTVEGNRLVETSSKTEISIVSLLHHNEEAKARNSSDIVRFKTGLPVRNISKGPLLQMPYSYLGSLSPEQVTRDVVGRPWYSWHITSDDSLVENFYTEDHETGYVQLHNRASPIIVTVRAFAPIPITADQQTTSQAATAS